MIGFEDTDQVQLVTTILGTLGRLVAVETVGLAQKQKKEARRAYAGKIADKG